jgi:hypothetical protein
MAIPTLANAVVGAVATEAVGKAAGANGLLRELGGVFGVAGRRRLRRRGHLRVGPGVQRRFAAAMGVAAGLALVGALAALTLPRRRPNTEPAPIDTVAGHEPEAVS